MIELLLVLIIATAAVLGWFAGSVFVCVFLSLPVAFLFLIAATNHGNGAWLPILLVALIVIWMPLVLRRLTRRY
jgi:hypothetical protein